MDLPASAYASAHEHASMHLPSFIIHLSSSIFHRLIFSVRVKAIKQFISFSTGNTEYSNLPAIPLSLDASYLSSCHTDRAIKTHREYLAPCESWHNLLTVLAQ